MLIRVVRKRFACLLAGRGTAPRVVLAVALRTSRLDHVGVVLLDNFDHFRPRWGFLGDLIAEFHRCGFNLSPFGVRDRHKLHLGAVHAPCRSHEAGWHVRSFSNSSGPEPFMQQAG